MLHDLTTTTNVAPPGFTHVQQWSDISPSHVPRVSIYCENIPSFLCCGDFIHCTITGTEQRGMIINSRFSSVEGELDHEILVNIWTLEDSITAQNKPGALNSSIYNFVVGMQGLAQTNWTTWVKINQVTDFIYVFHMDSIQSGLYANCYGMKKSFYTRYKVFTHRGHNTITTIAQNDHIPFSHMRSSLHPESSHHRIFQFLTSIRRHTDNLLYTERKFMNSNGLGKAQNLTNVHTECWKYFINQIKRSEHFDMEASSPKEKNRVRRTYYHNLSSSLQRFKTTMSRVEGETAEQLACLRDLLGKGFGYGVRRAKPKVGDGIVNLSILEKINAVDPFSRDHLSETDTVMTEDESPELLNKIIIEYNSLICTLSISCFYRFMPASSQRGQMLLQSINHALVSQRYNATNFSIPADATFMHSGELYQVVTITENGQVICSNLFNGTQGHTFDGCYVNDQINNHNR